MVHLRSEIFEIDTQQGIAQLFHKTIESQGKPVLLIHGFGSTMDIWFKYSDSIGNYFVEHDLDVWALELSDAITGNIEVLAHEDLLASLHYIHEKQRKKVWIISHSMGGIISRYLVSSNISHPYPLKKITKMINGVTLLATPNHGVGSSKGDGILDLFRHINNFFLSQKEIDSDINIAFLQLTKSSKLIQKLNNGKFILHPSIRWQNGYGLYDKLIPIENAEFREDELDPQIYLNQKEFPVDHMVYPFVDIIKYFEKVFPAIHRYKPVAEWILTDITNC
ncbi:MAG: esterase/lipase family protein [Candidatus Hodarchaeota archaeon]